MITRLLLILGFLAIVFGIDFASLTLIAAGFVSLVLALVGAVIALISPLR